MTQTEAGPGAFPAVEQEVDTRNIWDDEAKVELVAYAPLSNQIDDSPRNYERSTNDYFLSASWEQRGLERAAYVSVIPLQTAFILCVSTYTMILAVYQLASGSRGEESRSRTRS